MPGLLSYEMKDRKKNPGVKCRTYAECKGVFHDLLSTAGIHLVYSIDSDSALFESLFQELDRRKVTIGDDPIILIGEWDSFYARALPITFSGAACHYIVDVKIPKVSPPSDDATKRLHGKCGTTEDGVNELLKGEVLPQHLNIRRYSYLSGLDGESLEDQQKRPKSKSDDNEKSNVGKAKLRDVTLLEKPEGTSQLDYVRRLVSRIKSEEQDDVPSGHRKVQAIGILGRDSYDALLILQALREQFPTVLFFAPDLYARYFHESEQKWTRNLLVVSHFGLQLHPLLQQSIPPFRNTYQTSTFFALLRSIGQIEQRQCRTAETRCYVWSGSEQKPLEYSTEIAPRIFEIGRYGAVNLSVNDLQPGMSTVHPSRADLEPGARTVKFPDRIWMLWIVLLIVLCAVVWSYGRLWKWLSAIEVNDDKSRPRVILFRTALLAVPVLVLFALWSGVQVFDYDQDEPFTWSDGVSIWPTELIRFLTGMLCVWFLLKARGDLADNTTELTRRFFSSSNEMRTGYRHGFWSNLDWMFHGSPRGATMSAGDLWSRYCEAHRGWQRAGRVALLFLVYFSIIWSIWPLLNDGLWRLFVPCRGTVSCRADFVAILLSVVPLVVLNLSVLDAVLLCARWIGELPRAAELSALSAIRLIAERTRVLNRRILYAFIALSLVIAARNHYFDNWDFPPVLIVLYTAHSLVALASASTLYLAAAKARKRVLASIQEQLDLSLVSNASPNQTSGQNPTSDRLQKIINEIESVQQGAFLPFYQQPAVQATLVVALAFLQYWYLGQ